MMRTSLRKAPSTALLNQHLAGTPRIREFGFPLENDGWRSLP